MQQNLINTDILVLKPINNLLGKSFIVDNYQRGYKWNSQQVKDMLCDINAFRQENEAGFYCLQPVVVKYHDDKESWELIDGQQRITTIYLILTYFKKDSFKISYETRTGSRDFLDNITGFQIGQEEKWDDFIARKGKHLDNVDNYHFFEAWKTIQDWFQTHEYENWLNKLLNQTKVIWYEPLAGDSDKMQSIELFMRINSGKIPLTNSELIKALLLHNLPVRQDLDEKNIERIGRAAEWDAIEQALQDDAFWFFINKSAGIINVPNRIELLFDILAGKPEKSDDEFYTFRHFSAKATEILAEWTKVRECFSQLQEWFQDDQKYHLIGYLIVCKLETLPKLLKLAEGTGKAAFTNKLKALIKQKLNTSYDMEDLKYGETNKELSQLLLLFNIETMLQSKSNLRFPFDLYIKEKWSLEHIHAQNSQALSEQDAASAWYADTKQLLNAADTSTIKGIAKLREDLETWNGSAKSSQSAKDLLALIQQSLYETFGGDTEEEGMHTIENMALLDKDTNSSLNNAIFPIKRLRIIEQDKLGKFIPIATKNVFSKYYSKNISQMQFWGESDRHDYKNEIQKKLKEYLQEAQ